MPIDIKYKVPPSFLIDGINYSSCGYFRRPLPFTGPTGVPNGLMLQMYSPFVETRFYRVKNFTDDQLRVARSEQQELYYVSTGNFIGGGESRNAFIKSFNLSMENGFGAKLEIIDTSGNDFVGFYNTVYKNSCLKDNAPAPPGDQGANNTVRTQDIFVVSVNVGYIFVNSEGQQVIYQSYVNAPSRSLPGRQMGPYMNFYLTKIDVRVDSNIWRYDLELKASDGPLSNQTVNDRKGAPGKEIPFLRAAEIMIDGECPPKLVLEDPNKARVAIVKPPQGINGSFSYTSERGAGSGPNATRKGVYAGYNLTPLDAIRKNMDTFITKDNKGVSMFFPTGANNNTLYLMEAESNFCIQKRGSLPECGITPFAGTYVVNGGDFSPVINFNPTISFIGKANKVSGGVAGGGVSAKSIQVNQTCNFDSDKSDDKTKQAKSQGQTIAMSSAVSNDTVNKEAPKNIPQLQAKAGAAAIAAENATKPSMAGAITATLEIQGDPRFLWSLNTFGATIKIIFVNPFAISTQGSPIYGTETDWLATPKINSVISDGYYVIQGCDHQISNGSWRTTLKIAQVYTSNNPLLRG